MPPSTAVLLLEGLSFVFSTEFSDFINAVCFFPSFWYRYNVIMILRWGLICGAGLNDTLIVFYYLLYHCSNPLIYLQDLMSVSFTVSCTSAGASIVHTQPLPRHIISNPVLTHGFSSISSAVSFYRRQSEF